MLLAEKMEMLTSGEYNLTTKKASVHERKSILFVKLTDSAQRALSNYLRSFNSCDVPLIEFNVNEGRILIPSVTKSSDLDPFMAFKFDVCSNDTMQGKQGRFDCVQHKRGSRQLLKYGQLTQRLRIHANEDVYETTKNRMAAIEQQQRQNCTVQLDWNSATKSSGLNRKLKLRPKGFLTAANSPSNDDHSMVKLSQHLKSSNMIRCKSRPVSTAPPRKINPASCLIRKPLKERIIHLLAVKPHRRPELEAALKRDGLRDCDRSHVVDTLISVSTFRDNTYHLSKHAWNDVQEDWIFYTEAERQQVKKNKQQNVTSPSSSSDSGICVTSSPSPNNNHPSGGSTNHSSPPPSYKRPGYFNGVDGFQTKRQRISHFVKQEPSSQSFSQLSNSLYDDRSTDDFHKTVVKSELKPSPPKNSPSASSATAAISSSETKFSPHKEPQLPSPSSSLSDMFVSPNSICNGLLDDEPKSYQPQVECNRTPPKVQQALSGVANATNSNLNSSTWSQNSYEKPKYMKEYVTITNTEQRSRYKADFSKIFAEYERVHKDVDRVGNHFAQLGEKLKEHKRGSRGYEKVENEILSKYYALKNDRNFENAKRRYEYLHEKLSHIKNLVKEYDDKVRQQMRAAAEFSSPT